MANLHRGAADPWCMTLQNLVPARRKLHADLRSLPARSSPKFYVEIYRGGESICTVFNSKV